MPKIARKFTLKRFRLAGWGFLALLFSLTLMAAPLVEGAFLSQSESLTASKGLEQTAATADSGDIIFSKSFLPNTIGPGSVSTLQFVIENISPVDTVMDLAFTDTLPAGVTIATPANVVLTCPDNLVLAPDGDGTISFSGERLGAGNSCVIKVDVTSSNPGLYTNTSDDLTSSAGNSGPATADLSVATDRPGFSKSFSPSSVKYGSRSTLTFTIDNTANPSSEIGLTFTDNLPLGMEIADPPNASTTCGNPVLPPVLTAVPGTAVITLSAIGVLGFPAIDAGATCTVTIDVIGNAVGQLDNATEDLLILVDHNTTKSSGKASASLEVTIDRISLVKSFTDDPVPPGGTTTLEFTILNLDRVNSLTNIAFTDDLDATLSGLAAVGLPLSDPCGAGSQLAGTSLLTLSGGTLPAEGSCTFSITLQTPAGSGPGEYLNTTSSITADIDTHSVTGSPATDSLFIQPVPILTKEFVDDPVGTGGTVTMRFTITNSSTTSDATDITFIDELTTFLPVPISAILPDTPCGAGSLVSLVNLGFNGNGLDRHGLSLIGGSLAAGASCTFDVGLDIPLGVATGTYTNTTEEITAVVDGTTYVGSPASDDLVVVAAPQLTMVFTDDPVAPGGTVALEFTITNSDETHTATDITFTDDLAAVLAGLTVNLPPTPDPPCGAGSSLTGSAGDTLLTLMGGSLEPGASCTFSVTLDVPAGAAYGSYTNTTGGISATIDGMAVTSNPATDELKVTGLNFTKEFIGDPVIPGDTVTLRFTIDNISSADDATNMSFSDDLNTMFTGLVAVTPLPTEPCGIGSQLTGTSLLDFSGGNLLAGTLCTFDVTLQVPIGTASDTYNNTTDYLTVNMDGSFTILDPATDVLVVDSNLLSLTKEFTDDPVAPGDPVTLEFTLTNLDATRAASGIDFTDDLAAALTGLTFDSVLFDDCGGTVSGTETDSVTMAGGSLMAGGSCTLRVSLTVPDAAEVGIYTNTTSGVTGTIDGFPVIGDAVSDDLHVVKMTFTKSFDGPTTATGTPTLTFSITNLNSYGVSDLTFTDYLEAVVLGLVATNLPLNDVCGAGSQLTGTSFVTLTGAELPPMGGTCTFDVDLQVPASTTAGTFPNTTSDLFSAGIKMSDPATADLTIEPPPSFAKSFAPDLIVEGNISTLSFTIDNTASALAASSLDFTDNLPAGMTVANLPNASTTCTGGTLTAVAGTGVISYTGGSVDASVTCTIQVDVTGNTAGQHVNTTGDLTSSSGNSGSASDTLSVSAAPQADLSVTKSDGVTSAVPGESVTYTIVASNAGPSAEPAASLTDTFPPDLACTYTSVAAGGATGNTAAGAGDLAETLSLPADSSVTYTATCTIDSSAVGTLSNTATIAATVTDPNLANDSATDDDTLLIREPDLEISVADDPDPVAAGALLTYTVVVTNKTDLPALNVVVTDTLPIEFTHQDNSCGASGSPLVWQVGTLLAGSQNCVITGTVDTGLSGIITHRATVSTSDADPQETNNTFTDTTQVFDNHFSVDDVALKEGHSGITPFVFTVSRTDNSVASSVDLQTVDDTATAGEDYIAVGPTTLDFALGGSLTQTVTISVYGDDTAEADESFTVVLSNPSNGSINDGQGSGTIADDDNGRIIYLPVINNQYTYAPDLVVEALRVTSNSVQVTIKNQGVAPVIDEFWVDVYIDPSLPPTMVNQTWPQLAEEGLVWGVTGSALPLAFGDSLVLTLNDAYYLAAFSEFSGTILPETAVYAQVDSADANTTFGAVLETHEMNGDPYNNIFGTTATTTGLPTINWLAFKVDFRAQYDLPERP